jgi:hypothetical protein
MLSAVIGDRHSGAVKLWRKKGFGPDALFARRRNYRYGDLVQREDHVSAGATNARWPATGKIAIARGRFHGKTKGFMLHFWVPPDSVKHGMLQSAPWSMWAPENRA